MEKINIAELLKDYPKGTKLYSPLCGECELVEVGYRGITLKDTDGLLMYFFEEGNYRRNGECMIFPSKENRDWSTFLYVRKLFKDGDILVSSLGNLFIFKKCNGYNNAVVHCALNREDKIIFDIDNWTAIEGCRHATEEEKEKLFDAIKAKGYKWNDETKDFEKIRGVIFKVGDVIKSKCSQIKYTVTDIRNNVYIIHNSDDKFGYHISFKEENNYELVPNKFDITKLKTFDKVLVRCSDNGCWSPQFFSKFRLNSEFPFVCTYNSWKQCIPYEGNEHLSDTTNDCEEFYKNW